MFGYLRDPFSDLDYPLGATLSAGAAPPSLPPRLSYESIMGPADDQGQTSECVTYSVAALKRYHEFKESGRYLTFDPHELYNRCKAVDGVPGSPGTFPRVAMDLLRKEGMSSGAGFFKISTAVRMTSVEEMQTALVVSGPFILGIRIDLQYFANLGQDAFETSGVDKAHFAGHCMTVVGYEPGAFRIRNSWGADWGDNGHFWLPFGYLEDVDPRFDAWAALDLDEARANATVAEGPIDAH